MDSTKRGNGGGLRVMCEGASHKEGLMVKGLAVSMRKETINVSILGSSLLFWEEGEEMRDGVRAWNWL